LLLATSILAACSAASPQLRHTFDSEEALATAVLAGIARNDHAALEALALSEAEFRQAIWPELPAARPERNMPLDYVWQDLGQKSRASLGSTLARHGGRRYELVEVKTLGESTTYETFAVRRDTELTVRTEDGQRRDVRLFGSMVVRAGRYKIFSYVVD
jgi:hypothetical protein